MVEQNASGSDRWAQARVGTRPMVTGKTRAVIRPLTALLAALLAAVAHAPPLTAGAAERADAAAMQRLLDGYPQHLKAIEGNRLVWRDGAETAIDDGKGIKSPSDWLADPDVEDMLRPPYTAGPIAAPPLAGEDPGRARNRAFFDRIYGDCTKGEVAAHLVDVVWLPRKWGRTVKATRVNGVAEQLAKVSAALDGLPASFDRYLFPPAGTYNCRSIAGTDRRSAHAHGIAIDIATQAADYWRWPTVRDDGRPRAWRNRIPQEIVEAFERHGFIWGGKWHHYDTMHFEYRPELLPPQK